LVHDTQGVAAKAGFSLMAVVVAGIAAFFIGGLSLLLAFENTGGWFWGLLLVVAGLAAASVWLVRRSRIPLLWMVWPLLGASVAGFVGFVAWLVSVWEPMD
jgi:hypothetical protein